MNLQAYGGVSLALQAKMQEAKQHCEASVCVYVYIYKYMYIYRERDNWLA